MRRLMGASAMSRMVVFFMAGWSGRGFAPSSFLVAGGLGS
jgi:hypothetical protein